MDEQQQANQPQDPTQPVVVQPTEPTTPVTPQESPQQPAPEQPTVDANQAAQDVQTAVQDVPAQPVTDDDFINAYNELCKKYGKQFNYQANLNANEDGSFNLTRISIVRLVVDLPQE